MGEELTSLRGKFNIDANNKSYVIALAGNPNTGKSTIFNALTGLRQHTGNWPGKTVLQAQGDFSFQNHNYLLVDLPGIYSLFPHSPDEEVARDFLCFARPDATIAVADATSLERNLSLILQIIEITPQVVLCVNLIDEAKRKNIKIDINSLSRELGIPVIPTVARSGKGLKELQKTVAKIAAGEIMPSPRQVNYDDDIEDAVQRLEARLKHHESSNFINPRWLALRILDNDKSILAGINNYFNIDSEIYA